MRRRHQLQVNTFPFLAVLLCAMGSLILVLLVMDRRSHRAAQARAQEKLRLQAREEALTRAMQREEYEAKKRARDAAQEKKRAALRNRVDAEEKALSDELREVQERLAKTARRLEAEEAAVRKLRDQVKDEQERVAKQEGMLDSARKEANSLAEKAASADKARAKLAGELVQLEKILDGLKKARQSDAQTFSVVPYRGKRGDNRRPLYVECGERGFVFHPDQAKLDGPSLEALRAELARRIDRQKAELGVAGSKETRPYLMLLVRPDGIRRYYELQAAAKELNADFGYEFVNADWKFHVPDNPAAPRSPETARSPSPMPPVPTPGGGPALPGAPLVSQAPAAGNRSPESSNIGLTRPVPYGTELPPIPGSSGGGPANVDGNLASLHRPVPSPASPGHTGIGTPSLVPLPGGQGQPSRLPSRNPAANAASEPGPRLGSPSAPPGPIPGQPGQGSRTGAPNTDGNLGNGSRPLAPPPATGEAGIEAPALLPMPGGQVQPARQPSLTSPATSGDPPSDTKENGPRLGGPGPGDNARPMPLRPAQISGGGEATLFVECRADVVVIYPSRTRVAVEHLTHSSNHNKLYQTVRQWVARQQAQAPERKVQVRFLIHRDAERTFHRAYPVLEGLAVPKTQYNLMPDDDVSRIIAGY